MFDRTQDPEMREPGDPIAFVDGAGFYSTHKTKEGAQEVADAFGYVVRDYGVHIARIDRSTGVPTKWTKTDGYSVWTK